MLNIIGILSFVALIGGIKIKVYNDKQKKGTNACRVNIVRNVDG